jgi:membrane protein
MRFFSKPASGKHSGSALSTNQEPPGRKGANHNSQASDNRISPSKLPTAMKRVSWACLKAAVVGGIFNGMIETMIVSYIRDLLRQTRAFPWRLTLQRLRQRFAEDRLGQTAGALTFTTTIALVPLITVSLAVVTAFPLFDQFQNVLQRWLIESLIPDSISRQVLGYLTQFTTKASRLGVVSFAVLMFSALALVFTIDRSFNAIWRVTKARPWGQRLLLYWAALTLGPVLVAAGLVTMASVILWSGGSLRSQSPTMKLALDVLEFVLLWGGISALYRFVPNTHVPWRQVLGGSLGTTVVLEIARSLLTWYLARMSTFSLVYGAFATVPILLVWIYMTWAIVLLGAVLVASWPGLRMGHVRDGQAPGAGFQLALDTLRELKRKQAEGVHGDDLQSLANRLGADPLQMQAVLEQLQQLDWVGLLDENQASSPPRYVMLVDWRSTRVAPLLKLTLLADGPGSAAIHKQWHNWLLADVL